MTKDSTSVLKKSIFSQGDLTSTKDMLERMCVFFPNRTLLAELDQEKNLVQYAANQILDNVCALGDAFLHLGFENKTVGIMSKNCINYLFCEFAITNGIGVFVPMDKDAPPVQATTLLNKSKTQILVCDSMVLPKIQQILSNCSHLKKIITIDKKIEGYDFVDDLIDMGKSMKTNKFLQLKIDPNKTCKMLFTSGTTGANKCVQLSQTNIVQNIHNYLDFYPYSKREKTSMSILPFHHSTEVNTHVYPKLASGILVYVCDSIKNFWRYLKILKPNETTVVPMIANAIYKNIYLNNPDKKTFEKKLRKHKFLKHFGIDKSQKIFAKEFEFLGGNLSNLNVGGAPLNSEVAKKLYEIGIIMRNGYGITECGPLVSINARIFEDAESMGPACPRLDIKLCNENNGIGELCVRGKSVSCGYFEDQEATNLVFDDEGYFHTGDLVSVDSQGRLFLKGRSNNVIVLSNGKNVFPEEIEHKIEETLPYIKEVVVYDAEILIGKQLQNVLCAGVFIEDKNLYDREKLKQDFKNLNEQISTYKRIAYLDILEDEFEKTSSKKIKRTSAKNNHTTNKGVYL